MPTVDAATTRIVVSATISQTTRIGDMPMALSTPSSRVRSNTAISIVLTTPRVATNRMMKIMTAVVTSSSWSICSMSGRIWLQSRTRRWRPARRLPRSRAIAGAWPGDAVSRAISWTRSWRWMKRWRSAMFM